ncbi:uncharacterized protein LOC136750724 [Amia ocellicauda]|uniref:uncharacterized protein LOC136750724 n=1 Tax=Amia ocellicauda TaxID=2972642 RepID=UPI0034640AB0
MIRLCVTLLLFCQVYSVQMEDVIQPSLFAAAQPGDSVTLECYVPSDKVSYMSWFKQTIGQKPRPIAVSYAHVSDATFLDEFKGNPRFKVHTEDTQYHLTISRTEPSDTATYYCVTMYTNVVNFGSGTFLLVKGSGSVSRRVEQQPASVPVQPGDSVTLQCTIHTETCAGEHSVHWFRHGSGEALPGLIYTHGNRSDPFESSSEPGLPAQGCVYELPKRNLRSSDAGTYYCAVATCGQILFGNGTRLEFAEPSLMLHPMFLVLLVSNCVCVLVIAVLMCTRRRQCGRGAGPETRQSPHHHSTADWPDEQSQDTDVLNYAALSFTGSRTKPGRKRREMDRQAVYADVRCQQRD